MNHKIEICDRECRGCKSGEGDAMLCRRLSDLLDERTCYMERRIVGSATGIFCSSCDALMYDQAKYFDYCPKCGAKVVQNEH